VAGTESLPCFKIGFTNISHMPTQQRQFGEFRAVKAHQFLTSMQLRHCSLLQAWPCRPT